MIAAVAIWEGVSLLGVLLDGYVLIALPAFAARTAVVACLSAGIGLLLRWSSRWPSAAAGASQDSHRVTARWLLMAAAAALVTAALGGCGSGSASSSSVASAAIPPGLAREARPIGRGGQFHPAATGPVSAPAATRSGRAPARTSSCSPPTGSCWWPRASGWWAGAPRGGPDRRRGLLRVLGGTLEPTGVVLIRPGVRLTVGDLFRSWGQPLSARRLASFTGAVRVYVGGRRRPGPAGARVGAGAPRRDRARGWPPRAAPHGVSLPAGLLRAAPATVRRAGYVCAAPATCELPRPGCAPGPWRGGAPGRRGAAAARYRPHPRAGKRRRSWP